MNCVRCLSGKNSEFPESSGRGEMEALGTRWKEGLQGSWEGDTYKGEVWEERMEKYFRVNNQDFQWWEGEQGFQEEGS